MTKVNAFDTSGPLNPCTTLVYLDGQLVTDAFEADDEEGYVLCYKTWPPTDTDEEDELVRKEGKVEFKYGSLADFEEL